MRRVLRGLTAIAAAATLVAACSSSGPPEQQAAEAVKDATSATATIELALSQLVAGRVTQHVAEVSVEDAAESLDGLSRQVPAEPAVAHDAIEEAAQVAQRLKGADRARAEPELPAVKAALDRLEDAAKQLPPVD